MAKHSVYIIDHAHYQVGGSERLDSEHETLELAIEHCKKYNDLSLSEFFSRGMKADDLLKQFMIFGEEATCEGFDSFEYIKNRCQEMCS